MNSELIDAMTQDIQELRKRGDLLANSLEALEDATMAKNSKRLRGLQWWDFATRRIEYWRLYCRALDRDGIGKVQPEQFPPPEALLSFEHWRDFYPEYVARIEAGTK